VVDIVWKQDRRHFDSAYAIALLPSGAALLVAHFNRADGAPATSEI
jgi:hypothetical protein